MGGRVRFPLTRDVRFCALGPQTPEIATVPRPARRRTALLLLRRAITVIWIGAEGAHGAPEVQQGIGPRRCVALPLPRLRSGAIERLQEHAQSAPGLLRRGVGRRKASGAQLLVGHQLPYNGQWSSAGAAGGERTDRLAARGVRLSNGLRRAGGSIPER